MEAATIQRIEARVTALAGLTKGAADFSALVKSRDPNRVRRGAYVISLALTGGAARAATGAFVQDIEENLSVVLSQRAEDPTGGAGRTWIVAQRDAVIAAIAGWVPEGLPGPMRLRRGQLINVTDGVLFYQLDFSAASQLRIDPR